MTVNDDASDMEADLVALIEHRTKEVEHLRKRLAYSQSELDECEKKLEETKSKLVGLRSRGCVLAVGENSIGVKEERSTSPLKMYKQNHPDKGHGNSSKEEEEEDCKIIKTLRKPLLVIPALNPKKFPCSKLCESGKVSKTFGKSLVKEKGFVLLPKQEIAASSGTKRKFDTEEDVKKDLIQIVGSCSSACKIHCETSNYIPSRHMRKLRNLVLSPTNDQLFVTSALDGVVNLWQIQGRGSNVNHVSSINGASLKQRRWAEDVAWHPRGSSLISVYSADCGESQLAILNLNKGQEGNEVIFLEDKPHVKGIINNVMFMPWGDNCFVTCGSDHAVVHWVADNNNCSWKPQVLHTNMHSSAVMGAAGMQQKQIVLSVGADKKIIGFDLGAEKPDYKHQIKSKCMSIVPNPCDQNLFMVQTGSPQRQLQLFDMRVKWRMIHEFGWEQESSTSQSALINQAWSPDGLYLTSGSADPTIHIFDIRYNTNHPSHSIKAHHKRVFKAAWHPSFPILISISSDLNIGLHNITHLKKT